MRGERSVLRDLVNLLESSPKWAPTQRLATLMMEAHGVLAVAPAGVVGSVFPPIDGPKAPVCTPDGHAGGPACVEGWYGCHGLISKEELLRQVGDLPPQLESSHPEVERVLREGGSAEVDVEKFPPGRFAKIDPAEIPDEKDWGSLKPTPSTCEALPLGLVPDLQAFLGKYSRGNGSDTQDAILAQFLSSAVAAFDEATRRRDAWYDWESRIKRAEFKYAKAWDHLREIAHAARVSDMEDGIDPAKLRDAVSGLYERAIKIPDGPSYGLADAIVADLGGWAKRTLWTLEHDEEFFKKIEGLRFDVQVLDFIWPRLMQVVAGFHEGKGNPDMLAMAMHQHATDQRGAIVAEGPRLKEDIDATDADMPDRIEPCTGDHKTP